MSNQSNNQGRAYEYVCINTLCSEINKIRSAEIIKNSAYEAATRAWHSTSDGFKYILQQSAVAAVSTIFDMEPMLLETGSDLLTLKIQTDNEGKAGDVRDIIIARSDIKWEIGLSIKHNHFAVKHSRLAKTLDFGAKWFGIPCSKQYWNSIEPIFNYFLIIYPNRKPEIKIGTNFRLRIRMYMSHCLKLSLPKCCAAMKMILPCHRRWLNICWVSLIFIR